MEALDAVACGVDLVDASFAVHATSAGHAVLLNPAEWKLHDAELSEMAALEPTPAAAMQQPTPVEGESSQHAHRLHGKQRNPRNKPEVTMKPRQESAEMPLPSASMPAASIPADERQPQLPLGGDTGAAQSAEPNQLDREHTGSMGAASGQLQPPAEAAVNSGRSAMDRDAAALESQGSVAAHQQQPAIMLKSEGMQNKRGLAEEAPSHVKHPRHRAESDQGPPAEQPASSQDASAAMGHGGSAAKWGRKGQTASSAPGAQAAPRRPELPGSQHVLPSTVMLDVWKVHYRADSRPLSELCACSTCQRHSRAYIHHLLKTKEMLAQVILPIIAAPPGVNCLGSMCWLNVSLGSMYITPTLIAAACARAYLTPMQVLLEIHNTHTVRQFFARMREAVSHGQLLTMRAELAARM